MSSLEERPAPDTWEAALAAGNDQDAEEATPTVGQELEAYARAQEASVPTTAAVRKANRTPVTDAILERITPELVADTYRDALTAVRTVRFKGGELTEPDYATRLRAADAVTNRTDGMPLARSELTGAGGGPITLAALLATDARDTE